MPNPDWGAKIDEEATAQGLDPHLARSVANVESGYNPQAVSPKGARGIMQLMPETAKMLGVNADDPMDNIRGGVKYLKQLHQQFGGDVNKVLAAYNAGPGRANNPPEETKQYVNKVQSGMGSWFQQNKPGQAATGQSAASSWFEQNKPAPDNQPLGGTQPGSVTLGQITNLSEAGKALTAPGTRDSMVSGLWNVALPTAAVLSGTEVGAGLASKIPWVGQTFPNAAPWLGRMAGAGAASAGVQQLQHGEINPVQTALDVGSAGMAPLIEGAGARIPANSQYKTAVAAEDARAVASKQRFESTAIQKDLESEQFKQDAKFGSQRVHQPKGGNPTDVGTQTQADILGRDAATRRGLKASFEQQFSDVMDAKVGPPPPPDKPDTRPTFQQLHTRQSKFGDDAAAAWKSGDQKAWASFKDKKEKVLGRMQDYLQEIGRDQDFADWRQQWADMSEQARQPGVVKLMSQAHDAVSESLLNPKTLAGKRKPGGAFGGGTTSPSEIIDSLKAATSPQQFQEFVNATRDKLVDSAFDAKNGIIDPYKLEANIKKMGGNFKVFDPAEQKELQDAAASIKDLLEKSAKSGNDAKAARSAMGDVDAKKLKIPEVPPVPQGMIKRAGKYAIGGGILGGASVGLATDPSYFTAGSIGAGALGVMSILRDSPALVKGLLRSPEARRGIAQAAGKSFQDPIWDKIATMIVQGFPTAAGYALDIPEPPQKAKPR